MPEIALDAVVVTYPGEPPVTAVDRVSLTIGQGEHVAVTGSSGSGKSTLLGVLALLDEPSSGVVLLDGVQASSIRERTRARLRSRTFGFVFQAFHLLERRRASENVELGLVYRGVAPEERARRAREALDAVGLGARAHHPVEKLSGGERQRVAIARAMAMGAPVIVADEPTGNLDSVNGAAVLAALRKASDGGQTVILVTHDAEVAAASPRRLTMRDGELIHDTGPARAIPGVGAPEPPGTDSTFHVRDVVGQALSTLRSRPGRAAALVGALAAGVGLGVATLGLTATASAQISDRFDALESTEIQLTREDAGLDGASAPLGPDAVESVRGIAGVAQVGSLLTLEPTVVRGPTGAGREATTVFAVDPTFFAAALSMDGGPHHVLGAGEVVLGAALAREIRLGPLDGDPVVWVGHRPYVVREIVEGTPRYPVLSQGAVLPWEEAAWFGAPLRSQLAIRTAPGAAQQVARQAPLAVDPYGVGGLEVGAPPDPSTLRQEIEGDVRTALTVLTFVTLALAVVALANAMATSVDQRRGEIGLRRALGAQRAHVRAQVAAEATLVGLAGGGLGLLLALCTILAVSLAQGWIPVFDLGLAPLAVLGGTLIGTVSGLLAAYRASRVEPSAALRG